MPALMASPPSSPDAIVDGARIGIVILDEARRGVGVDVIDQLVVGDVDLRLGDDRRHGHDQRELLGVAGVVRRHGDDRAFVLAGDDDLGRLVEQFAVGLGDVEAAEGVRGDGCRQHGSARAAALITLQQLKAGFPKGWPFGG